MIKSLAAAGTMFAMALASTAAYAVPSHVHSTSNPIVLEGYASLGTNNCYLYLNATLGDSGLPAVDHPHAAGWYNTVTNVTGSNDMSRSDPGCAAISIVGGSGVVSSSSAITLSNLLLQLALPSGTVVCPTGTLNAEVTNVSASEINVFVDQLTPCGYIVADLNGLGQID